MKLFAKFSAKKLKSDSVKEEVKTNLTQLLPSLIKTFQKQSYILDSNDFQTQVAACKGHCANSFRISCA